MSPKSLSRLWSILKVILIRIIQALGIGLALIILAILITLAPLKDYVFKGFFLGKTLIVITNENEARPCGGFATAFSEIQFFPPSLKLQDIYSLKKSLGKAEFPLTKVSKNLHFWDLGTNENTTQCAQEFQKGYQTITGTKTDHVVLVDFQTLENIFNIFSPLEIEGKTLHKENFFATISRSVADIDRHDEITLQTRKSPMKTLTKAIIKKGLHQPHLVFLTAREIQKATQENRITSPKIKTDFSRKKTDFGVIEWNLGGGKSSRYLKKNITLSAREVFDNEWKINLTFTAQNLAHYDEPIAQDWHGGFTILFPEFLKTHNTFISTDIPTNGTFKKSWFFEYHGKLPKFGFFVPRSQNLLTDTTIVYYPQKTLHNANFETQENIGTFFQKLTTPKQLQWNVNPDTLSPFVTLHEVLADKDIRESALPQDVQKNIIGHDLIAEIHFNEKISLGEDFEIYIRDRNWEHKEITDHPSVQTWELLDDKRTLLIGASQQKEQLHERFSIEFTGVYDAYRNEIHPAKRTLIDRTPAQ